MLVMRRIALRRLIATIVTYYVYVRNVNVHLHRPFHFKCHQSHHACDFILPRTTVGSVAPYTVRIDLFNLNILYRSETSLYKICSKRIFFCVTNMQQLKEKRSTGPLSFHTLINTTGLQQPIYRVCHFKHSPWCRWVNKTWKDNFDSKEKVEGDRKRLEIRGREIIRGSLCLRASFRVWLRV